MSELTIHIDTGPKQRRLVLIEMGKDRKRSAHLLYPVSGPFTKDYEEEWVEMACERIRKAARWALNSE